jgi:hypothetical protein
MKFIYKFRLLIWDYVKHSICNNFVHDTKIRGMEFSICDIMSVLEKN